MKIDGVLPYSHKMSMNSIDLRIKILYLVKLIIIEVLESIEDFYFKNNFLKFDCHVGENLCQIRACLLLFLYKKNSYKYFLGEKISQFNKFKNKIDSVNSLIIFYKNVKNGNRELQRKYSNFSENLLDFISQHNLNLDLTDDIFFLFQGHFLTKFKILNSNSNISIDYDALNAYLNTSKNIARKIVHIYQINLSRVSCSFIYQNSSYSILRNYNTNLLDNFKKLDDDSREVLPSFVVMDILLGLLLSLNSNLLFIIKKEKCKNLFIFYVPDSNKYKYSEEIANPVYQKIPCLVFYGITDEPILTKEEIEIYIKKFNSIKIEDTIMCNMAAHPQYSGKKLEKMKENPFIEYLNCKDLLENKEIKKIEENFLKMKKTALINNLSNQEKIFFYIRHIFSSTLEQQLLVHQKNNFYDYILNQADQIEGASLISI